MSSDAYPTTPEGQYEVTLTPPTNVTFFHHTEFDGPTLEVSGEYTVTWRVEQFSYAINSAFPPTNPSFDGSIYVIFLHRISSYYSGASPGSPTISFDIQWNYEKSVIPVYHCPETGSGVKSGDDYQYHVQFKEDMQMLINEGQDSITFKANYDDTFTSLGGEVTGSIDVGKSAIWSTLHAGSRTQTCRGFSLFKSRDLQHWPVPFRLSFLPPALLIFH